MQKKGEIHLGGLGDEKDKKKYLEKLQKLTTNDVDIFEKLLFSKNSSEDGLIELGIGASGEISGTSNLMEEKSLSIVNDL